jgi:hypothetical protein
MCPDSFDEIMYYQYYSVEDMFAGTRQLLSYVPRILLLQLFRMANDQSQVAIS